MLEEQTSFKPEVIAHAMRCVWNEQHPFAEVDVDALMEGLKLTPWERILANDIAVNYLDSLIPSATPDAFSTASPTY